MKKQTNADDHGSAPCGLARVVDGQRLTCCAAVRHRRRVRPEPRVHSHARMRLRLQCPPAGVAKRPACLFQEPGDQSVGLGDRHNQVQALGGTETRSPPSQQRATDGSSRARGTGRSSSGARPANESPKKNGRRSKLWCTSRKLASSLFRAKTTTCTSASCGETSRA